MTQPLAIVVYEKILPGSQLINRLQDLNYRVLPITDIGTLIEQAQSHKPMLVLADLESSRGDVCAVITNLKNNAATRHVPVIAFANEGEAGLDSAAGEAGAALVVSSAALLSHLPQILERALQVE